VKHSFDGVQYDGEFDKNEKSVDEVFRPRDSERLHEFRTKYAVSSRNHENRTENIEKHREVIENTRYGQQSVKKRNKNV
jgi:hypothetical protein